MLTSKIQYSQRRRFINRSLNAKNKIKTVWIIYQADFIGRDTFNFVIFIIIVFNSFSHKLQF